MGVGRSFHATFLLHLCSVGLRMLYFCVSQIDYFSLKSTVLILPFVLFSNYVVVADSDTCILGMKRHHRC